jgi:hypothetical protein
MSTKLRQYRRESDKTENADERIRRALETIEVYKTGATSTGAFMGCCKLVEQILKGK